MPFKHTVTDSRGKVHTRTSAERSYPFAVVRHYAPYINANGTAIQATSYCSWSSREDLARKELNRYLNDVYRQQNGLLEGEIIPCTPVPTGKHLQALADAQVAAEAAHERKQLGS